MWRFLLVVVALLGCTSASGPGDMPERRKESFTSIAKRCGIRDADSVLLVHRAPRMDGGTFDPEILVDSVNRLRALGFDESLKALEQYRELCRKSPASAAEHDLHAERIFLVCRLLFIPMDAQPRRLEVRVGQPSVVPLDAADWPLFPLGLSDDLPFLLVAGYSLGGRPQDPKVHLDYCREHCRLREHDLTPGSPFSAAGKLLESPRWTQLEFERLGREWYAEMIRHQALRCVPSLTVDSPITDEAWGVYRREYAQSVHWSHAAGQFELTK